MLADTILPYTADTVAEWLLAVLDQAAAERGRATLAVPGGRSPGPVLERLAAWCPPFVRERLHLCWVDERAVPRDDPQRNDAAMLAAWQSGGPLPAHVEAMPAEEPDLEAAAHAYGRCLAAIGADQGFDAVLLGIGEDGHIASLFPDHPLLDDFGPVCAIHDSPKPPPRRLTVALPVLGASRAIAVLALGRAKGAVLARARAAGGETRSVPVSLLPAAPTRLFLDDAATAGLVS